MKIPYEILALGQIHAHLAAHARVDLREERRRHLHIRNPAHERRGHKSAHVAHNPAAKGNQQLPRSPPARTISRAAVPRSSLSCVVRREAETASPALRNSLGEASPLLERPQNFFDHKAQISGDVTTNTRRGSRPTARSIRGASSASNPLPANTSYFAEAVSTRIVCTVISMIEDPSSLRTIAPAATTAAPEGSERS
jgi:hypothetical protein